MSLDKENPFRTVRWNEGQVERLTRLRVQFWDTWHLIDLLLTAGEFKTSAQTTLEDSFLQCVKQLAREDS